MKTRTRMFSYIMAFLMLLSCVLSMGWLSVPAYAGRADGGGDSTGNLGGGDGTLSIRAWGKTDILYAVYPTFSFGDGDGFSLDETSSVFKNLPTNSSPVMAYRNDAVYLSSDVSGQIKLFSGRASSDTLLYYDTVNVVSPPGAWGSIFDGSDYIDVQSNGKTHIEFRYGSRYSELQKSHDVEWEYQNLYLPLLSYMPGSTRAAVEQAYSEGKAITLVIEPYWEMWDAKTGSSVFASTLEVSKFYNNNYLEYPSDYSYGGENTVSWGLDPIMWAFMQGVSSNGAGNDFYPVYQDKRNGTETGLRAYNKNVNFGWSFFSIVNGEHGGNITFDITKACDIKASKGADVKTFEAGVEASFRVIGVTEDALIDSLSKSSPNAVTVTSKTSDGILKAIQNSYAAKASNVEILFSNASGGDTGVKTGIQFTQNKKVSIPVSLKDAAKVWYFCVVEEAVSSSCTEYEVLSTPTPGCMVLKYTPTVNSKGEVTSVSWTVADLKKTCKPDEETLCSFEATSTSKDKVAVKATNPFEIVKGSTVDFVAPSVTVLDVDDYYVTGYKTDYGFTSNQQLVYTRSTLINPDNAPFFPAYAIDSATKALNNSKAELDKAAKDNNVATLNVPKDSATYAEKGITSKYHTIKLELQPDAIRSFTVNKDYIRDYSDIRNNSGSISSAFNNTVKSAETEQGTLSIPFSGGESYSLGNNTTDYQDYVKYAEMYAKYEAALAASAGEVRAALTHWSTEAMNLYAKAQSIYNGIPSDKASRTLDAVTAAWGEISDLGTSDTINLQDITGWSFKFKSNYYVPYERCNYCNSRYCDGEHWEVVDWDWHCSSPDCWLTVDVYGWVDHGTYTDYDEKFYSANGGSSLGVKIKGVSGGIQSSVAPRIIQSIFSESNAISTSSLLGRLCDINTNQLKEITRLEKGRPHAEIHQYNEFATEYDDTIYQAADVPEWYIAMRWKDQKAFLKNGSLLSTLLDFEAHAPKLSNPAIGTNAEVDTNPLVLLQKIPEGFNTSLRGFFNFRSDETSSATTAVYSPMFAWYYKDTSLLNTATKAVDAMGTGSFTVTGNKTKDGRFLLNTYKTGTKNANLVYIANLDAYGYAQTAIASWTSVWQIIDGNPTNDFLPDTDWTSGDFLPNDVSAAITIASRLPNAKRQNMANLGANAKGKDTYVIGNPDAKSQTKPSITMAYSKNALTSKSRALIDYYINAYNVGKGGTTVTKSGTAAALKNWFSDKIPYTLESEFKHFNVGDQPGVPYHDPESDVIENNSPTDPSTTDKIGGHGRYTRDPDKEVFSIYPLVKRGYYEPLSPTPTYTYTVGQKPRTLNSHVYYYMGITGTANPTVVANALGSGSAAVALSNRANGAPVALSGTGITVSYDPNVSLIFQSFNLCNIDADQSYQNGWGNVVNENETAHLEWLHSLGATDYTATAADGSPVTTLGIPYIAGVDCNINNKASAWQLTQDGAKVAIKNDNAMGTQEFIITMRVEKGELIEVNLPTAIISPADGSATIAKGTFRGSTTKATLGSMPAYLADAIRGTGITGDADCVLKQTFVNGAGTVMVKDANGNIVSTVAAEGSNWYNEYCYCIGLKFASTVFNMQPLMFTDKIPIELGPKTPASKNDYYKDGYGFVAQSLMLKVGADPDPTQTSITAGETGVEDLMNEVWMITRDDMKVDLVISNVPVTGANN